MQSSIAILPSRPRDLAAVAASLSKPFDEGMRIDFVAVDDGSSKVLKSITTNADGRPPEGPLMTPDTIRPGRYQAVLHIADYYRAVGAQLPAGFHTKVILEFDITDAKQPHHLPFQITPWTQSASVLPG